MNSRILNIQSRILALQGQQATTTTGPSQTRGAAPAQGSFASQLRSAVAASQPSDKTYKLNSKGIPEDLAAYGNGKIPPEALGQVGGTRHKLWAPAAESLNRMIEDAKR
ncbi:MAG TPA: peptidase M15, partial [Actinoplanes sp.]|nr:peptidase M15 [Actinoplanes sp.]